MKKLFLLLLFLLLTVQAEAATRYVRAGCTGTAYNPTANTCTGGSDTVFSTINTGLAATSGGDTLIIRGGTYTEVLDNNVSTTWSSGSAGAPTIVQAFSGETVTVNGGNSSTQSHVVGITNRSYITLDGIHVDAINTSPVTNASSMGVKIDTGSNHIRFINGEVQHFATGIQVADIGSGFNDFVNNDVHECDQTASGGGSSNAFYIGEGNNLIQGNRIYNCHGYGVQVYNQSAPTRAQGNTVVGNLIYNTDIDLQAWGGMVLSGTNNTAYNNIVRDAQGTSFGVGIDIHGNCVNCKVYNNTIYNNHWFGINVNGGASGTIIQNNIIFNNGAGAIQNAGTATTQDHNYCNSGCTGTGTINSSVNPFVNSAANNFTLTAALAGTDLSSVFSIDFVNAVRTVPWDMGAYEFTTGTGTVTDNFNRANGALGANWLGNYTGVFNFTIVGNKVRSGGIGQSVQVWSTPAGLTQSAQVTLATLGTNGDGAVILRATAPPTDTFYYIGATRAGSSTTYIYRCEAGPCSLVHEDFSAFAWSPGDRLKATIDSGGNISIFRNGTLFTAYTDPTPLTGTFSGIGMFVNAITDVELDDFDNGVLAPTPGTITWTCDRCAITSGSAVGTAPPSLTNWVVNNLALAPGVNIIAVTVTDSNGNASSDTLLVNFVPSFPGNTLAGSWGFEAGSGTTAIDSSGNSNDATFVGSPTWQAAGRFGNAISFNGIDQSLNIPDPANNSLDFTQSFTLSAWIQPSVIQTDYRAVMAKANTFAGVGPVYSLYASVDSATCHTVGSGAVTGLIRVNGASGPSYVVCGAPLATGVWTHIAVTYDGFNLKLYRNGVLEATTPVPSVTTPPTASIMEPSTGPLQIGASEFGEQFAGAIDEPRTYNYALPITAGSNTVPGAACVRNQTASVVGDMNCSVVAPVTILAFKLPASATGIKIGPTGSLKVGSQ